MPGAVLASLLVAAAIVVFNSEGYRSTKVDLNDASVWITRATVPTPGHQGTAAVGRLNMEVSQVDTKIDTDTAPDVLQAGDIVFIKGANSLKAVNAADPAQPSPVADVPAGAQVALGGSTLAMLDSEGDALHVVDASHFDGAGLKAKPTARVRSRAAQMAVGTDGSVHVVDGNRLRTYAVSGKKTSDTTLPIGAGDEVQVSAAASRPVVLDLSTDQLVIGHRRLDLKGYGGGAALELPSDDPSTVVVATDAGLLNVPTAGGAPMRVYAPPAGAAKTIQPVRLNGCSYGAWQSPGWAVQACDQAKTPLERRFGGGDHLRFRVNHKRVTLNDTDDGNQLLVDGKPPQPVDGAWNDALTVRPEQQAANPDQGQQRTTTDNSNQSLSAQPIEVSARPGTPRTIGALAYAPGALYVTQVTQPSAGTAAVGLNGQTIEFDPGDTGPHVRTFSYTVSDGIPDHTATNTVTVTIVDKSQKNQPPRTQPDPITVAPGGTAVVNVLANDDDPDGDGLVLTGASTDDASLETPQFQPDGVISVRAGVSTGRHVVAYKVTDDLGAESSGELDVTVSAQSKVVARDDFALGHVGDEMSVRPLANDLSPSGPLRIASVTAEGANAGSLQIRDRSNDEVRFVASAPGLYTAKYSAVDDASGASGDATIRLVVAASTGHRPTAARDNASLATDVPVVIPVLANDSDPDGDLLAVTGVDPGSRDLLRANGIDVEVLKRQYLRVTAHRPIPVGSPLTFRYDITDGTTEPVSGAVVLRGLNNVQDRPPIAADDNLVIGPGKVSAVRVLDNDLDPEGGQLTIARPAAAAGADAASSSALPCTTRQGDPCPPGTAFVQGDLVRVVAPATPGSFDVNYTALDPAGNRGGAVLHVTVQQRPDQAPLPPVVEARTSLGRPISIPIPVVGADPDGDVVTLVGVASAPLHGTLPSVDSAGFVLDAAGHRAKATTGSGQGQEIKVPANSIYYQPVTAGSDEFTYTVRDPDGLEGRGTVRIAVIPNTTNSPPVAVPDHFVAVPGKTLEADVLANDSDPDGDEIHLIDNPQLRKGVRGVLAVRTATGVIVLRVEGSPGGKVTVPYEIADSTGQTAQSTLTVDIVAKTAGAPPVAVDDVLPAAKPGQLISARILDNDADPDGLVSADTVTTSPPPGLSTHWNGVDLTFRMPNTPVQFPYTLRDKDGNTASAFVVVPLSSQGLQTTPDAVTVKPGQTVKIDVTGNDLPQGDVVLDGFTKQPSAGRVVPDGGQADYTAPTTGDATVDGFSYKVHQKSNPTHTAEGAVTVTIQSDVNHPPSLSPLEVQVPAGGSGTIEDLTRSVVDPDTGQHFTFTVSPSASPKIHADVSGSRLTVTADKDAYSSTKGQVPPLQLKVTDSGSPPLSGTAEVRVVLQPTTSPPPVVSNDSYDVARKDGAIALNVLANDVGSNLKIVGVTQPTAGGGHVAVSGDQVEFTPPPDAAGAFSGTTTFTYQVTDDSGEASHQVAGTVTVNVVGKPDAPGKPTGDAGSKQVTLRWNAPNANGSPITHYVVEDGSSGFKQSCDSTSCTLTGLTNGTTYHFTVRAYNTFKGSDVAGDPSPASDDLKPDKKPDPPAFSAPVAGDQQLTVSWTDATTSEGTAIQSYQLQLSPGDGPQPSPTISAGTHTATFTNLKNGTGYQVTIKARNAAGDSDPSQSPTITPYGKPIFPSAAKPTATAGDQQIDVSWPAADTNGSAITKYHLTRYKGGSQDGAIQDFGPDVLHTTVQNLQNGTGYTFAVTAENARGVSDPTGQSAPVTASGKPAAIGTVTATEGNQQATLAFTAPDNNGSAITSYQVSVNGSNRTMNGAATGQVSLNVTGLTNGTAYTFGVAACNQNPTATKCGAATSSNQVTPYGPPGDVSVTSNGGPQGQGNYHLTWSWSAPNPNGRAITGYIVQLDGGSQGNVGPGTTSYAGDYGPNETHTLRVWAVNAPGSQSANPGSANATTGPPPPPQPAVTVYKGNKASPFGCNSSCTEIWVSLSNFSAGGHSVKLYCDNCGPNHDNWGTTQSGKQLCGCLTAGNGNTDTSYAYGYGGTHVWAIVDGQYESPHALW